MQMYIKDIVISQNSLWPNVVFILSDIKCKAIV